VKIGCLIEKASNWKYKEVRVFCSYARMVKFMRETYNRWVVKFLSSDDVDSFDPRDIEKIKKSVGECDLYIRLTIYDDYIE